MLVEDLALNVDHFYDMVRPGCDLYIGGKQQLFCLLEANWGPAELVVTTPLLLVFEPLDGERK